MQPDTHGCRHTRCHQTPQVEVLHPWWWYPVWVRVGALLGVESIMLWGKTYLWGSGVVVARGRFCFDGGFDYTLRMVSQMV